MYNHDDIDKKWQIKWEDAGIFHAQDFSPKEKFYCLIEFPFPSGEGLHVGHPRSYTALDVVARKKRMDGFNVLYPIGWDAFGLPTENFAIKTGRTPQDVTAANIATFKRQIRSLGISFDWSREVNTSDPAYYKWTQWMFLQFYKAGLAYKTKMAINWCQSCKIGLANEEVVNGTCERCGGAVEEREKEQWMIKITEYADKLIDGLEGLDYLEKVKKQQIDWIGKSEGAEIEFAVDGTEEKITVFTTRPDTIFGVTFMVLAPEHPLVASITTDDQRAEVEAYVASAASKSDRERMQEKEKTGVFTGAYATHPISGEKIPVWVADYVLASYGTGAIMAVPAHDERDHEFATKFSLAISDAPLEDLQQMITKLEHAGSGKRATNYKLRDWVFSRQRYWGEPIPLVNCADCGWVPVPEDQLPVVLPVVKEYQPTDDGESPLAKVTDWVNTPCPTCGKSAQRETDTMPNWAGSSWYFLRYMDPSNNAAFADPAKLNYWGQVDWYNGGMEHTTLHLLYSRFWNKFLHEQGHVPHSEPYAKRTSHGLIMAEDGTKMSKSKGNVVNPDEIVKGMGADTLRMYELFIGAFSESAPWSTNGVSGVRRFLDRVSRLPDLVKDRQSEEVTRGLHQLIKNVGAMVEDMRFNSAVAEFMGFVNTVYAAGGIQKTSLQTFLLVLCPFAPHLANELHEQSGGSGFLEQKSWPEFDESLLASTVMEIAVQVNGKLRATVSVPADSAEAAVVEAAKADANVAKYLTGEIRKTIYIPGKLVSFVV